MQTTPVPTYGLTPFQQFQLGGVELFALLTEEPPSQGIKLLTQNGVLAAGLLQRLLQRSDLLAQLAQLVLE
jgi:hypothetical protein